MLTSSFPWPNNTDHKDRVIENRIQPKDKERVDRPIESQRLRLKGIGARYREKGEALRLHHRGQREKKVFLRVLCVLSGKPFL